MTRGTERLTDNEQDIAHIGLIWIGRGHGRASEGSPSRCAGASVWKRKKGWTTAWRAASRDRGWDSSKNAKVGKVAPKMEGGFADVGRRWALL